MNPSHAVRSQLVSSTKPPVPLGPPAPPPEPDGDAPAPDAAVGASEVPLHADTKETARAATTAKGGARISGHAASAGLATAASAIACVGLGGH